MMTRNKFAFAVLGASAFAALGAAKVTAQEPAPADAPAVVADEPAPDEATANNEFLQAQVESLQSQIDSLKKQMTAAQPTWKGAPQWTDADSGFTFKPKGVLQFDAGYVSLPGSSDNTGGTVGGVNTNNLGFNSRARRLIFGAEGAIPGGFGYKMEFELSQQTVNYEDLIITYQKPGSPILFTVGHHYPLSSLELLTSNRFTSFMERAAIRTHSAMAGVSAHRSPISIRPANIR
jgi:phosphate-selective porin OprO/OprP